MLLCIFNPSDLHLTSGCYIVSCLQGEYESLAKKLSEYVVKLLDHVRGNDELDIILNEPVEGYGPECQGKLSRLKLAIKCNEKQVDRTSGTSASLSVGICRPPQWIINAKEELSPLYMNASDTSSISAVALWVAQFQ